MRCRPTQFVIRAGGALVALVAMGVGAAITFAILWHTQGAPLGGGLNA